MVVFVLCPLFVTADSSGLLALRMSAALGTACPGSALGREWVRECVGRVAAIVVYARRAHVGRPAGGRAGRRACPAVLWGENILSMSPLLITPLAQREGLSCFMRP